MNKEVWGALVDAVALIVSLLASYFLDAELADLIVGVVVAAQPVVLIILAKSYADRKAAEVRAEVQAMRDLVQRLGK
jgi:hypothetical protein